MNLKCKIISNIKIFNFFIIHVAINFSENIIKNYGWVSRKKKLIVDFSNDNNMFATHKKWKNMDSKNMS
jgi:hypothetical protein